MEGMEMTKKPKLQIVQPAPVGELSIKDLIVRFESDIKFSRRKPAKKYENSEAAKELVKRGLAAARAIKRYLDKKVFENRDERLTWKLLRDDVAKANTDVNIPEVYISKE